MTPVRKLAPLTRSRRWLSPYKRPGNGPSVSPGRHRHRLLASHHEAMTRGPARGRLRTVLALTSIAAASLLMRGAVANADVGLAFPSGCTVTVLTGLGTNTCTFQAIGNDLAWLLFAGTPTSQVEVTTSGGSSCVDGVLGWSGSGEYELVPNAQCVYTITLRGAGTATLVPDPQPVWVSSPDETWGQCSSTEPGQSNFPSNIFFVGCYYDELQPAGTAVTVRGEAFVNTFSTVQVNVYDATTLPETLIKTCSAAGIYSITLPCTFTETRGQGGQYDVEFGFPNIGPFIGTLTVAASG